jgi:hypothetical protein
MSPQNGKNSDTCAQLRVEIWPLTVILNAVPPYEKFALITYDRIKINHLF